MYDVYKLPLFICIYREYKVAENSDTIPYVLLLFFKSKKKENISRAKNFKRHVAVFNVTMRT